MYFVCGVDCVTTGKINLVRMEMVVGEISREEDGLSNIASACMFV
jgi:hypothetical protein